MAAEQPVATLGAAIDAFLARADLAASSRRSYAQTLTRLKLELGAGVELGRVDGGELGAAVERAWGGCAPATWNRRVATTRSFVAFCRRRGWLPARLEVHVERRREPADRTRAIAYTQIDRLWRRGDVAIREKALWRLLYETAARASAIVDVCPVTGRARLSYRRAQELFAEASGGWTLHQLRHSAITHLAEGNVGLALLMAKSRHTSLRSLQRYARPGAEAVAAMTAAHDPDRRRR